MTRPPLAPTTPGKAYDVVVCGGGLAGLSAAVAAARLGARVALVQDRPVLGGNSSSEVRVTPHGAGQFHAYARETGIISELLIAERALNHEEITENGWTNSVWDLVQYELALKTPGLELFLNTSVTDVVFSDGLLGSAAVAGVEAHTRQGYRLRPACAPAHRLSAVRVSVAGAEATRDLSARLFIDCTGDALVAHLSGCEWRMGSESRAEFGEPHAPLEASTDTMGNSLLFKARDTGREAPFTPPDWAVRYEDEAFFYDGGRSPREIQSGYWWIEIGVPWNTISDNETIRHELTRHLLGVWDWIKNRDPRTKERARTFALDWFGQVPGKRESRRVLGRSFVNEHAILERRVFPDEIAYGGWFLDLHTPGGLLAPTSEPASAEAYNERSDYAVKSYCGPYGLPLSMLVARDVDNLLLAGRNVSATHAALGTVRVMNTTALLGQAAGTAAALALRDGWEPASPTPQQVASVQQSLLRQGCFLPNVSNQDPADLARQARVTASSEASCAGIAPDAEGPWSGCMPPTYYTPKEKRTHRLDTRTGLCLAVSTPRVESLAVCLRNSSGAPRELRVEVRAVDQLWDYRSQPGTPLATGLLQVPPGECVWVDWPCAFDATPGTLLRLDLLPAHDLEWWIPQEVLPGLMASYEVGASRMRRLAFGCTPAFRIEPPQACYGPANATNGVSRPQAWTNLWRSDPAQALPAHLELAWPEAILLGTVSLTFAGNLLREYHAYPPFYRDPQTVGDYRILAEDTAGNWNTLVEVSDNYQRHRLHALPAPVTTRRLRLEVLATWGDPSAAVYEIRCSS
jgi:hypothetical protein